MLTSTWCFSVLSFVHIPHISASGVEGFLLLFFCYFFYFNKCWWSDKLWEALRFYLCPAVRVDGFMTGPCAAEPDRLRAQWTRAGSFRPSSDASRTWARAGMSRVQAQPIYIYIYIWKALRHTSHQMNIISLICTYDATYLLLLLSITYIYICFYKNNNNKATSC